MGIDPPPISARQFSSPEWAQKGWLSWWSFFGRRLVGKQAMTIEILEAAREVVKKSPHLFKGSGR